MKAVLAVLRAYPLLFAAAVVAALVVQLNPAWRGILIYDRTAIGSGEVWRLWTGHLVHFGWPHFIADVGLLAILGHALGRTHACFSRLAFAVMPLFISLCLYVFEPAMQRYAGLSALDLGMLLYLAGRGWQRNWRDWFWPAILAIYVIELGLEITRGGEGGGVIRFDDPSVRVATGAHLAGAAYAVAAWIVARRRERGEDGGREAGDGKPDD
jgi:rhomboid family GlyGly-CTERM serine protease